MTEPPVSHEVVIEQLRATIKFKDESIKLLMDANAHWVKRASEAERELRKWYGYVNKTAPPEHKPSIIARFARLFIVKRGKP